MLEWPWAADTVQVTNFVGFGIPAQGLMHELLDGAVEHARASGAIVIEGYPVEPEGDRVDQTSAYVGTVRLFEAHGFGRILQTKADAAASRAGLSAASSPDLLRGGNRLNVALQHPGRRRQSSRAPGGPAPATLKSLD